MPDPRFFDPLGPVSLGELAQLVEAEPLAGESERTVSEVAPLERADGDSVAYYGDRRYSDVLGSTRAAACFVTAAHAERLPRGCTPIVTGEPQVAYLKAALRLHRPRTVPASPSAIHPTAVIEADVQVSYGVVVGPDAHIGRGTVVGPGAVIGAGVAIGRDCVIGPNAVIGFALIGDRVRILAGAVIGEAGFGVAGGKGGAVDVPQLGRVILQDGVTVGANSCIDRGAWDDTVVGENTKIDNLVQIGHNVRLGRNCLLAAHTGISGSTVVGDGVRFGGRAGIADHLTIGDGASVMAAAGLMHDIPAGEVWGGIPATPARQWMRQVAWLARNAQARGGNGRNEKD